jgi:SAM-dependent methyltransferase
MSNPQESNLLDCTSCGTSYFSSRYTDAELDKLYSGYRGTDYVRLRRRWEPWYRASVNDAFEPGSAATRSRVEFMESTLLVGCPGRVFRCIVDIGGDAGQFFPTGGNGRRILIDPSNKPLPAGVERVVSLDALPEPPDLMLLAHVLEHVREPVALLRAAGAALAPDGRLYVEVPWDRPPTSTIHLADSYGRWLPRLAARRLPFVAADFVSGGLRQYRINRVPLPVVKQSEHLNYFTPDSLVQALAVAGFEAEHVQEDRMAAPAGLRLGLIAAVARKRAS